ncbi:hypothetical protein EfmAA55_11350 [Enterococcus faecium]|nr:hypothetical protein EfmAA55_11350 [Enterococcus faecium]
MEKTKVFELFEASEVSFGKYRLNRMSSFTKSILSALIYIPFCIRN